MTDCFALLGVPRRPWLDTEVLKARFHELSQACHPDRVHGGPPEEIAAATARYTELNAAFNTLQSAKERLAHLLELERGAKPHVVQDIPAPLMDLCMEVGAACRRVDVFLAESAPSESPMLKAGRFARALEQQDAVTDMLARLRKQVDAVEVELRDLNPSWDAAETIPASAHAGQLPLARVEELWRLLSYLSRWTAQLQERNVRLTL
jgi:curved DNA-binding protein CbpA